MEMQLLIHIIRILIRTYNVFLTSKLVSASVISSRTNLPDILPSPLSWWLIDQRRFCLFFISQLIFATCHLIDEYTMN